MDKGVPLVLPTATPAAGSGDALELQGPRCDFVEIARALSGEVLLPGQLAGSLGRFQENGRRLGYWGLAWRARRADPPLVVSLSEKIGMCVSLLTRPGSAQVVIAHNLTTRRRRALQDRSAWLQRVDRVLVLSRPQEAYLLDEVKLDADKVRFLYDKVDHRFFAPQGGTDEGYVLSVGQNGRDYRTLFEAVGPTGTPTVVVPSSKWIPASDRSVEAVPANVTVCQGLSSVALRRLYDRASVVVVPLESGLEWAAGVNGVLEAMAMRKPLIVSATPGIADYVSDGENALVVPPRDPRSLGAAIATLLAERGAASRLGAAGHAVVESGRNLDGYVANVTAVASELLAEK